MRLLNTLLVGVLATTSALAQSVQRSSNPQGVQIQGDAEILADQKQVTSVATGEGNVTSNISGVVKVDTQIQGNVKIISIQKDAKAISVGKNNEAGNQAGVIGGK